MKYSERYHKVPLQKCHAGISIKTLLYSPKYNHKRKERTPFEYRLVPWFSWEEWEEVYRKIFGNCVEEWKEAFDQIAVWKSRMSKLPVGVEGTIPLLHSLIAQADPAMENVYKNSLMNLAIIRFVSIITQGNVVHNLGKISMLNAAQSMNLPPFIIELRNGMVHDENTFGCSETLKLCLDSSMQWIKANYWRKESYQMQNRIERLKIEMNEEEEANSSAKKMKRRDHLKQESLKSFTSLHTGVSMLMSVHPFNRSKEVSCSSDEWKIKRVKIKREFGETLQSYLRIESKRSMKVVVRQLFYAENIIKKAKNTEKGSKLCSCRCCLPASYYKFFSFLLELFFKTSKMKCFMTELLSSGEGYADMCSDWIRALVNTALVNSEKKKCTHIFIFKSSPRLQNDVWWRSPVFNLFTMGTKWSSKLALEILESGVIKLSTPSPLKTLKTLSHLFVESKEGPKENHIGMSSTEVHIGDFATLDDLRLEAKQAPDNVSNYLEELCAVTKRTGQTRKRQELTDMRNALGVLPHQVGNPYLYRDLILQPSKRRKENNPDCKYYFTLEKPLFFNKE